GLRPVRVLPAVLRAVLHEPVVLLPRRRRGTAAEVDRDAPAVQRRARTCRQARLAAGDGHLGVERAVGVREDHVLAGLLLVRGVHLREGARGAGPQLAPAEPQTAQPSVRELAVAALPDLDAPRAAGRDRLRERAAPLLGAVAGGGGDGARG